MLLDHSLRIVAAAAAVGLILAVLRVRSGAARHAAWTAVLVAMMTMPMLTAIVPRVDVPVPSTLALDPGTIAERFAVIPALEPEIGSDNRPAALTATERPIAARRSATLPSSSSQSISWTRLALRVYVAGLVCFLLRLAAGWSLARRLVATGTPVFYSSARVLESPCVAAPLTTGILSPVIVLPSGWRAWRSDTLGAILAHEAAHVARRDPLTTLLAQVNRAIFWFHPLAWWLVRAISTNAELACDERVVKQTRDPRRYAEILLEMAAAVNVRGSRVTWPAMGVDGSGFLGARIDRLLRGDVFWHMSPARRFAMATACGAALLLVIACRQQVAATPLRPDPEVSRLLDANKARRERFEAAIAMSASDVAALEASLEQNPADVLGREKLLTYYRTSKTVAWKDKLSGIRRHTLWFIEHAPDGDVSVPVISQRYDPQGYEEARRLWVEHTSRPDVSVHVISRAADFLSAYDKPLAEELLLRGRSMDPDVAAVRSKTGPGIGVPSWSSRLGSLYARAIVGNVDAGTRGSDPALAAAPFAADARRKLDATTDAQLLHAAGRFLMMQPGDATEPRALGKTYLERALLFDPDDPQVRAALANAAANDRSAGIAARMRAAGARDRFDEFSDVTYGAVSALPVEDRLFYLPRAAESAYMRAEYIDYAARKGSEDQRAEAKRKADAGWTRARQYAEDALSLAEGSPTSPEYGETVYRAHVVLSVLALKDGDRRRSVEHMQRAARAPASEGLRYMLIPGLRLRLVEYLLREGERESVAAFLEKSAELSIPDRERLLKDASQIRQGIMPHAYQYAEARKSDG